MKIKSKNLLLLFSFIIILSGCSFQSEPIKIVADDVIIELGTELEGIDVINLAIDSVDVANPFYTSYNSKLKGFEAVDWQTTGSYKLSYEVCLDDKRCVAEDFELNIVNNLTDQVGSEQSRDVYINATGLDVPVGTVLSEHDVIDHVVVQLIDSQDGSFKQSLSIEQFSQINWYKPGEYVVSVGGCDSQLNCDETDVTIHVRDDIDQIRIHNEQE